jgi:hypothetical protein
MNLPHFAFVFRALLTNAPTLALRNVSSSCSMPLLERIRRGLSGTTLNWQYSHSTTNAISEVLLFSVCVCVCNAIHIYMSSSPWCQRFVCVRVCVRAQCDIYLSILNDLSIYLSMYLVCISDLYVPGPCRARGACAGVCHVCVCVCVCFIYLRLF